MTQHGCFPDPPHPSCWLGAGKPIPNRPGVYFAWIETEYAWECVYVGESRCLCRRLANRPELEGATITYLLVNEDDRKRCECFYIGLLDPRLNCQSTANVKPNKGARRHLDLIWEKTRERGFMNYVTYGKAYDTHVAKECFLKLKVVRAAWKMLQKEGVLTINNSSALINSWNRLPKPQSAIA